MNIVWELSILQANQVLAALEDRLLKANDALPVMEEGSLEEGMVASELQYTNAAFDSLKELVYGEDEPDEPAWLEAAR